METYELLNFFKTQTENIIKEDFYWDVKTKMVIEENKSSLTIFKHKYDVIANTLYNKKFKVTVEDLEKFKIISDSPSSGKKVSYDEYEKMEIISKAVSEYKLFLVQVIHDGKGINGIENYHVSAFTQQEAEKVATEYFNEQNSKRTFFNSSITRLNSEPRDTPDFLFLRGPGVIKVM